MKLSLCILLLSVIVCVSSSNYFYGNKTDYKMVFRERVLSEAIPFKKRIQYLEYKNSPRPIKAIYCYDYQNSQASANITDGGLDQDFVTLRMKSQKSYRLDYAIEIYA